MRRKVLAVVVLLIGLWIHVAQSHDLNQIQSDVYRWKKHMASGVNQPAIQHIAISGHSLWVSTVKAIYQKKSPSEIFQVRFNIPPQVQYVYELVLANGGDTVYVASDQGLYQSIDEGKHWQRIYDSADQISRACFSVVEIGDDIFIGTQKGLLRRAVDENSWEQISSVPNNKEVQQLNELNGNLYALTSNAVYEIDTQTFSSKEIYRLGIESTEEIIESDDEAIEINKQNRFIADLTFDVPTQQFILATSNGLLISTGPKFKWEQLTNLPVSFNSIQSLIALSSTSHSHGPCPGSTKGCLRLLLGSVNGVYLFNEGNWSALNQGLLSSKVNHLTISEDGNVYAATDYGLYELTNTSSLDSRDKKQTGALAQEFEDDVLFNEPTIQQVQAWVIDYAEVSNTKISEWRRLAKKQALLPSLNIGMDGGRDWDRGDSLFGSSSGGGTHYIAPDDKSRGEDIGFDISLSWDLGDYIWSTDQTTIDSRSKLMVELRETLLAQVTQLYFERYRLQLELRDSDDESDIFDKHMRIMEITALLDASTGGKFSEHCHSHESENLK